MYFKHEIWDLREDQLEAFGFVEAKVAPDGVQVAASAADRRGAGNIGDHSVDKLSGKQHADSRDVTQPSVEPKVPEHWKEQVVVEQFVPEQTRASTRVRRRKRGVKKTGGQEKATEGATEGAGESGEDAEDQGASLSTPLDA